MPTKKCKVLMMMIKTVRGVRKKSSGSGCCHLLLDAFWLDKLVGPRMPQLLPSWRWSSRSGGFSKDMRMAISPVMMLFFCNYRLQRKLASVALAAELNLPSQRADVCIFNVPNVIISSAKAARKPFTLPTNHALRVLLSW